jgi:hypothetical protein
MIPGIVAGQMRVCGGAVLWTPLNMATVPQIYLDAQDSVVTDVSGACSAISNLGAMGANGDFSQSTSGNRPAILAAELNGKRDPIEGNGRSITCHTHHPGRLSLWHFKLFQKANGDHRIICA